MRGTASWDHSGILKLLVTAFAILLAPLEVYAQGHDTVWVWSAMCGQPRTIALDVRLDQSLIYHTRLPMCRVERALEIGETIRFSFTPHRPIVCPEVSDSSTFIRSFATLSPTRSPYFRHLRLKLKQGKWRSSSAPLPHGTMSFLLSIDSLSRTFSQGSWSAPSSHFSSKVELGRLNVGS